MCQLELQLQCLGGELNQWRHLFARRREIAHKFATADLLLGQRHGCDKVLHPEVVDKAVIWIKSARRTRQSVTLKRQPFPDFGPLLGVAYNRHSHFCQSMVVWMPDTCRGEAIVRL